MWYKLFLLALYFLFLFTLARLLEIVSWCGSGVWYQKIFDPMSLSVSRLKAILETRGIGYDWVLEKQDLSQLVDATGVTTGEELLSPSDTEEDDGAVTNFIHGLHFLEEVEDKKDSVWLVQVKTNRWRGAPLGDAKWSWIRKKLARFGVRAGVFDCAFDPRMCAKKNWDSPRLILGLTDGLTTKGNVSLYTYEGRAHERDIIQWVNDKMATKICNIRNHDDLQKNWLTFKDPKKSGEIRVLFYAKLAILPLLFSALSFKFPGRVNFAVVGPKLAENNKLLTTRINNKPTDYTAPSYVVIMRGRRYVYGLQPGELFSFRRMELFLKTLYPEINDIFLVILFICNWLSWLQAALCRGSLLNRFLQLLWYLIKYNVIVIVTVLPTIALFRLPYLDRLVSLALSGLQSIGTTTLAAFARKDLSLYQNELYLFLPATAIFFVTVALVEYIRLRGTPPPPSHWLDLTPFMTSNYFRAPFSTFSPFGLSVYPNDSQQIELVNEHITQPSLWLRPTIDTSYMAELPTWSYCRVSSRAECLCKILEAGVDVGADNECELEDCADIAANLATCKPCLRDTTSASVTTAGAKSSRENCDTSGSECGKFSGGENNTTSRPACRKTRGTGICRRTDERGLVKIRDFLKTCGHDAASLRSTNGNGIARNSDRDTAILCGTQYCHDDERTQRRDDERTQRRDDERTQRRDDERTQRRDDERTQRRDDERTQRRDDERTQHRNDERTHECNSHLPHVLSCTTRTIEDNPELPAFPVGYLANSDCVICLEKYDEGAGLCGLPCGHSFHDKCIMMWLARDNHFCPVCRWPSYKRKPAKHWHNE